MTAAAEPTFDTTGSAPQAISWFVLLLVGLVSLIAGIVALVYPDVTLVILSWIVGISLIIWGVLDLARAVVFEDDGGRKAITGLLGLLAVVAGIVAVFRPGATTLALVLILGFWFIWTGAGELALAFTFAWHRWWHLALGLASVVFGIVILLGPGVGVKTLALLIGLGFIVRGLLEIGLALAIRFARAN